jgi:predicted amidohydrolase
MTSTSPVKVVVAQAAPILFDREATVEKACQLIREVAKEWANLTVQNG